MRVQNCLQPPLAKKSGTAMIYDLSFTTSQLNENKVNMKYEDSVLKKCGRTLKIISCIATKAITSYAK